MPDSPAPELILRNANVITMNPLQPTAQALALGGGRILAVGSNDALRAWTTGPAQVRDLGGRTVLPGFYDSHNHMLLTGLNLAAVDLSAANTVDDVLTAMAHRAAAVPSGQWVLSSARWHESQLAERRFPHRTELDRASSTHPILLQRGGHNVVANTRALEVAGITPDVVNPLGGTFVRDADGTLSGHAIGAAAAQIRARMPAPARAVLWQVLARIEQAYNAAGITSVIDPGLTLAEIDAYRTLASTTSQPTVRASLMWRLNPGYGSERLEHTLAELASGAIDRELDDPWTRVLAIKVGVDGGVEAGFYREPYLFADDPANPRGKPYVSQENLEAFCVAAARAGWQVGAHCVGDAAIDATLLAFAAANAAAPIVGRRWTLIHMMYARDDHWARANQLGVIVTAQQPLLFTLADGFRRYIGPDRTRDIEPLRMYLDRSTQPVGGGSDSPVTPYEPLLGIWSSVTRQTQQAGVQGLHWRISVEEALRMYTLGSAYAAFEETRKGSIEPGKLADLVVLDQDPRAIEPEALRDIKVVQTFVDGRCVFER
jgi:predicted amidohydrolase YtcJ